MIRKKTVVIGLLGTTLDRGRDRSAGTAGGRRSICAATTTSSSHRFELLHGKRDRELAATRRRRTCDRCRRRPTVRQHVDRLSATRGTSARSTRRSRVRAGLSVRPRARGLSRARHDGHARRADLPVPADRDAHDPGAAAADARRRESRGVEHARIVQHHRSRSVEVRPPGRALRAAAARGPVVPQGGHRDAQPGVQRSDRAHRAGRRSPRARRCC